MPLAAVDRRFVAIGMAQYNDLFWIQMIRSTVPA